jgi:hypothetical protein
MRYSHADSRNPRHVRIRPHPRRLQAPVHLRTPAHIPPTLAILPRVTIDRCILLGLFAALFEILVLRAGGRLDGWPLLALLLAPLIVLWLVALVADPRGWGLRLVRSVIGGLLAGAAGLAVVFQLKRHVDWYDFPADSGGHLWLLLLGLLSAIPGAIASAARWPSHGFGLAFGLLLGLGGLTLLVHPKPGFAVLLAVGTLLGALVSLAGRPRR